MVKNVTEKERLITLEIEVREIKANLCDVKNDIKELKNIVTQAMAEKLDKKDFDEYKSINRTWTQWWPTIVMGVITLAVLVLRG